MWFIIWLCFRSSTGITVLLSLLAFPRVRKAPKKTTAETISANSPTEANYDRCNTMNDDSSGGAVEQPENWKKIERRLDLLDGGLVANWDLVVVGCVVLGSMVFAMVVEQVGPGESLPVLAQLLIGTLIPLRGVASLLQERHETLDYVAASTLYGRLDCGIPHADYQLILEPRTPRDM
jgi:hypothetical protein